MDKPSGDTFAEYARSAQTIADRESVLRWAYDCMDKYPPVKIFDQTNGREYLHRWHVLPRNDVMNLYLHRFVGSDPGPELHDHRGDNVSWLLEGEYDEVLPEGVILRRRAGDRVSRYAATPHRVELVSGPTVSLFMIGPVVRDWGFWVPWKQHLGITDRDLL